MVACVALQEAEYLYLNKHHALMTGKRALNRRKPCTITPCSVLCLVGIYTLMKRLGHSSIKQTEDYIKNVLDSIERKKRIKGCGLLMDIPAEKPSIYAVDALSLIHI